MADERTSGGGFQAVVRRGVYKSRKEAKIAAETKTGRNVKMAIERAEQVLGKLKADILLLKNDLKESKVRLKYWQGEPDE